MDREKYEKITLTLPVVDLRPTYLFSFEQSFHSLSDTLSESLPSGP